MTTEHTLSIGQEHQVILAFTKAGITPALAQALITSPDNADAEWLLEQYRQKLGMSHLFVSLQQQMDNVRRWNIEQGMGFSEEELVAVDLTPTGEQSLGRVEVLVPISRDMATDQAWVVDQLWLIAMGAQPSKDSKYRNPELVATPDHLRPLPGVKVYERGIYRVVLDLSANWTPQGGRTLIEVRQRPLQEGDFLATIEILAAAAHFPAWIQAMDGVTVPFVDLVGYMFRYDVSNDKPAAWSDCPFLSWWPGSRELGFYLGRVGPQYGLWAAPLVLGVAA